MKTDVVLYQMMGLPIRKSAIEAACEWGESDDLKAKITNSLYQVDDITALERYMKLCKQRLILGGEKAGE